MQSMWSEGALIRRVALIMLVLLAFAACASGPRLLHKHEFTLSPGKEHHPGLSKAILLPINATNEEPIKGLDVANDRITALLLTHLESKGVEVEKVDPAEFKKASEAAHRAEQKRRKSETSGVVAAEVVFGDLVPAILEDLDESAQLVISPSIVMRTAVYKGTRTIVWDGVRRRERVGADMIMSGSTAAASIRISVFDREGDRVFSGYGGLEPPFMIDSASMKYVLREDLFQDERNLREGICIALYPYFGMSGYCSR
jgi:hypothetical protein